jgi:hypothetical protein
MNAVRILADMGLTYKITYMVISNCFSGEVDNLHLRAQNDVISCYFHGARVVIRKIVACDVPNVPEIRQTQRAYEQCQL